jgi:hypothetical protein
VVGCGESCPREYVTGESLSTAQGFASRHQTGSRGSSTPAANGVR